DKIDVDKMSIDELKQMVKKLLSENMTTTVIHENKPLVNDIHPTMKPLRLVSRLILNSSLKHENVIDFFAGSGSTLISCEELDRKCYAMELDPKYVDVIIDRWEKLTGKTSVKYRKEKTLNKISLNEQAQEILRIAEKHGVEQNYFFLTTFNRYQVQIGILNYLEKTIREEGTLVTKEYVKGRKNVYSHPAISDYNRTTDSANKTVVTLMKIITTLRDRQDDDEPDPLLEILNGRSVKID
ncbi:MAG: site-specific DNA-methyltransferase, partial [Clostridia bacterium]|nr:site-specific DNA-methyltransferase [Clostridia bacterium]